MHGACQPIPLKYSVYISYTDFCSCVRKVIGSQGGTNTIQTVLRSVSTQFTNALLKQLRIHRSTAKTENCSRKNGKRAEIDNPIKVCWPTMNFRCHFTHDHDLREKSVERHINRLSGACFMAESRSPSSSVENQNSKRQRCAQFLARGDKK